MSRSARLFLLALIVLLPASTARAAEGPEGEWLVEEQTAHIRIENCDGKMWGIVSWEKDPGVDSENPDPRKRSRSTTGMPIILGMTPSEPNLWEGDIYNSNDGRTYSASLALQPDGKLRVRGCILGFLCGGEDWVRVAPISVPAPKAQFCARLDR